MTDSVQDSSAIPPAAEAAWNQLLAENDDPKNVESFRALAVHAPEAFAGYVMLRTAALTPTDSLPTATRELILLAALCMARKASPGPAIHVRKAMAAGASVSDIAEMVSLVLTVGGMVTYQSTGRELIEAAEAYERELGDLR
jgi:alkylhydroperoxidase/carboxymuconolactone decarboxylase family protein YurZ